MKKMHVSDLKQDNWKVKNNNNHSLKFSGDTKEGNDIDIYKFMCTRAQQ